MSETFFIADLHLDSEKPEIMTLFTNFLSKRARFAKALYILGDLFEVWIGDDEDSPFYSNIIKALRQLTAQGVPVFILHGNRDFLLGENFMHATGCQLLSDFTVISLYGTPTLLMHGDTLCTLDTDYQAFRQQVRDPQWQAQFLSYPLAQRRILAQQARQQSIAQTNTYDEAKMDVTMEALESVLKEHDVYHVIHGHTHKPALHEFTWRDQTARRYVLGDWQANSAMILSCTADNWILCDWAKS